MPEKKEFGEQEIRQMVKIAAVQNYREDFRGSGMRVREYPGGAEKISGEIFDGIMGHFLFKTSVGEVSKIYESPKYDQPQEACRLLFVPLSYKGFNRQAIARWRVNPTDYAVYFGFWGSKLDHTGRPGTVMQAVVVMSRENASKFSVAVRKDPTLYFDFLRTVNGGPITQFDGAPAKIVPGKSTEILANKAFGGGLAANEHSAEFPAGYDPNPLFPVSSVG